jgi:flagellar protein FlaG
MRQAMPGTAERMRMEIDQISTAGPVGLSVQAAPARVPRSHETAAASAVVETAAASGEASAHDVRGAVEAINNHVQSLTGNIQFSLDQESGDTLVKILDRQTHTVLMQIPSKQALEIAKALGKQQGLLIKEKV